MAQTFQQDRWRPARSDEDHARIEGILVARARTASKMKSPLEMVASAVRAVDGDVDFAFALANQVAQLGQPLYRKQEPTGYSNSEPGVAEFGGLLARMNFAAAAGRTDKVPGSEGGRSQSG